jgi:hypothetical protein
MTGAEKKAFPSADETRTFSNGQAEILNIGGAEIGKYTFQPGWRWSNDVKPVAMTESCQVSHFGYQLSGRLAVRMDDGTEFTAEAGDVSAIPPGHDAWVVGDEPVTVLDWTGASDYAKGS